MRSLANFLGTYAFRYTEEMRAWWEQRLRAELSDEALVAEALAKVDAEARGAKIEITPDGQIVSRSGDQELYRAQLRSEAGSACFDKPGGVRVVLTLAGADEIAADEPGKPPMHFARK